MQEIAPDMVQEVSLTENYDGASDKATTTPPETFLEVDPNKFTYALINAVQEQQEIIEQQNNEIDAIKAELEDSRKQNAAVKAKQEALEKEMAEMKAILKSLQK